eukprot:TRINITY_DN8270_c0_g1_i2.p1 TRINITY_DN8270_c0_g1~~TRINITY_DN8270_c0_g1_i2.p1  ORF type:complete len:169 (-),score=26.69 TRINITY_DN8270_c0_g1_i2:131-637(-)
MFKSSLCKFWLDGACTRGADCTWSHGDEDYGYPKGKGGREKGKGGVTSVFTALQKGGKGKAFSVVPPPRHVAEAPSHSVPVVSVKRTLCKFFLEGVCTKGDQCTWAHSEEEIGQALNEASAGHLCNSGITLFLSECSARCDLFNFCSTFNVVISLKRITQTRVSPKSA